MPMRNWTIFHQPCGQKRVEAGWSATSSSSGGLFPPNPSGHEPALRGWCARIHVAAAVQVVVDLGGAAKHTGIEEVVNAAVSSALLDSAPLQYGRHRIFRSRAEITASMLTQ